jgi:hypothetical protein
MDDRYTAECPDCLATGEEKLTIIIQPVRGKMIKPTRLITEAQTEAEYGKDWRETDGSRRMLADEPERLYSGTHSGPARRKGKAFLNK